MKPTRTYTMSARAKAVEQTRQRILEATLELSGTRRIAAISLDDVATAAGVSVQTVLRQFGSRAALIDATTAYADEMVVDERRAPAGDVRGAVAVVGEHYEKRGEAVLLLLAQEIDDPIVRRMTTTGKRLHREWVTKVFAPWGPDDATLDLLVVATDVYTWKLLRHDRGLSRPQTEARMVTLVQALLPTSAKD
ncbi:MAG TPA: TetR/AcrR family transcriptional regulator [Marmoricola sp.]|jgi:AcrR family transcriptional regulator|nr:TetR/AcrR family transcriptional regulator [Marmoricola sp.]